MKILLVGAGAVGQVYGRHLQRGGAQISFLVRQKYAETARAGFSMKMLKHDRGVARLDGFGVLTDLDAVALQDWDQLWLCISSPALRGAWLAETIAAVGSATIVSFQPGLRDRQILAPVVPADRLVKGLIAFSSWHAPLPGGVSEASHTAYWSPPLSPSLFEGPGAAAAVDLLSRGGLAAKVGPALTTSARGSAFLLPCVAAMECGGWSFAGLRQTRWSSLAARAGAEALAISCAHLGISKGAGAVLMRPSAVRLASLAAPVVAPFDIETFLAVHFCKVGDQTAQALDTWIAEGHQRGLRTVALEDLRAALGTCRGQAGS